MGGVEMVLLAGLALLAGVPTTGCAAAFVLSLDAVLLLGSDATHLHCGRRCVPGKSCNFAAPPFPESIL